MESGIVLEVYPKHSIILTSSHGKVKISQKFLLQKGDYITLGSQDFIRSTYVICNSFYKLISVKSLCNLLSLGLAFGEPCRELYCKLDNFFSNSLLQSDWLYDYFLTEGFILKELGFGLSLKNVANISDYIQTTTIICKRFYKSSYPTIRDYLIKYASVVMPVKT